MLPDYVIRAYDDIPKESPVSVLIRHSIRYPINSEDEIWTAGLTPEGVEMARNLGDWLNQKFDVTRIETSPIKRCVDTGRQIASALNELIDVSPVKVLSHPNENGEYDSFGEHFTINQWPKRIRDMAAYLVPNGHHKKGLNLFVSHDTTLVTMAGYWLQKDVRDLSVWPNYLEPFFLWWDDNKLFSRFRDITREVNHVIKKNSENYLFFSNNSN